MTKYIYKVCLGLASIDYRQKKSCLCGLLPQKFAAVFLIYIIEQKKLMKTNIKIAKF